MSLCGWGHIPIPCITGSNLCPDDSSSRKGYLKENSRMEYRLFTTEEFQYGVVVKGGETVLAFLMDISSFQPGKVETVYSSQSCRKPGQGIILLFTVHCYFQMIMLSSS